MKEICRHTPSVYITFKHCLLTVNPSRFLRAALHEVSIAGSKRCMVYPASCKAYIDYIIFLIKSK